MKRSLQEAEVFKMSITNSLGCGRQKGYHETRRGVSFEANLLERPRLEIAANEDFVQRTVKAIG